MAIKPNNAYPNLTTDYLADYTLGFTFAPLLMKIPLNTDLTIRPDQLFWHRDFGLLTKAFRYLDHVLPCRASCEAPPKQWRGSERNRTATPNQNTAEQT
jgi:hypothetical protein